MVFTRNFREAANHLAGLDWRFRFLENWYFSGELFLTNTRELNDTLLLAPILKPLEAKGMSNTHINYIIYII